MTSRPPGPLALSLLAAALLAGGASSARAQQRLVHFRDTRVNAQWFPTLGTRGPWPAVGATVDVAALECTYAGAGGGRPVTCRRLRLSDELAAAPSRFAACYALHEVALRPAETRAFAATGVPPRAQTLLLVRRRSFDVEELHGRCHWTGIDSCMSGAAYPVVGHRTVRHVEHLATPWSTALSPDPFEAVRSTLPWLVLDGDAAWPAAPGAQPFDEAPLVALTAASAPTATRFAAWVDLASARLVAHDLDGARDAFAQAAALAPALTGTDFVAPDVTRAATSVDADAVADGPGTPLARAELLYAMLGAGRFPLVADAQHAAERARDLRAPLAPLARDAHVFVRGEDPLLFVPGRLGELARRLVEQWTDRCTTPVAPQSPTPAPAAPQPQPSSGVP